MSASGPLPAYGINSVDNALRVIELLRSRKLIRLSSVCEELDLAPATAHRLLTTLQHRRFAAQDASTKVYVAGPELTPSSVPIAGPSLKAMTNPILRTLSDATGETANLLVLSGEDALVVDGVSRTDGVQPTAWVGITLPAHRTAAGKVLLAELSETDYATSHGELDPGIAAVAVPARLCNFLPVALAITAPPNHLNDRQTAEVLTHLRRATVSLNLNQTNAAEAEARRLGSAARSYASLKRDNVHKALPLWTGAPRVT